MNIVVADDDLPSLKILSTLLQKAGATVIECQSGGSAIEALENAAQPIAAVVSDYFMPDIDGMGVLKFLRKSERFKDIPFFLLTGAEERDVNKDGDLGLYVRVEKPVNMELVTSIIAAIKTQD